MLFSGKANKRVSPRKTTNSRLQQHGTAAPVTVSFLFVVNEFVVDYEPLPGQGPLVTDQWFNLIPPPQPQAYQAEYPGVVFRYSNGEVTPAEGYQWYVEYVLLRKQMTL